MFRSFLELQRIDPGFDPHRVLTFQVLGMVEAETHRKSGRFFIRQVEDRLKAIPGVESVTASSPFPLAGGWNPIRWGTEEALADAGKFQAADNEIVLPATLKPCALRLLAAGFLRMTTTCRDATW